MKSTALTLLTLAATGLAAPVFSQDPQPAEPAAQAPAAVDPFKAFEAVCDEIVNAQERCTAAVVAVKDAGSAAAAAKVLREETQNFSKLRKGGIDLCPGLADGVSLPAEIKAMSDAMEEALTPLWQEMSEKLEALETLDYYGCTELKEAYESYVNMVVYGMSPQAVAIFADVVQAFDEAGNIRYEAWAAIASVNDRASAEAASAKLAELSDREDKNVQTLQSLFAQVPEDEVDGVAQMASGEGGQTMPQDTADILEAAKQKLQEMSAMDPAFYGVPGLQEHCSRFIMMPR